MDNRLTTDEFDALRQIDTAKRGAKPSACVARNSKKLNGLKFITHERDGSFSLTDKGRETLFLQQCIDALRSLTSDPYAKVHADVAMFLGKKGHVVRAEDGALQISQRGRESLADIDAAARG